MTMNDVLDRLLDRLAYHPDEPLLFNSGLFLFLFLGFTFVYYFLRHQDKSRMVFVVLFSYYFYYKSSGWYLGLLAFVTVSDYCLAKLIRHERAFHPRRPLKARLLLMASIVTDLSLLGYFKYTNFLGGLIAPLFSSSFDPLDIFLPIGISFFIFQSMSYTIDVYRDRLYRLPSLLDYAFYVSFFPQLVAGPIVRACDFVPQIHKPLRVTREMFSRGVGFILMGLFKKAVISDYISLNFVDRIFDNPGLYTGVENLLGIYGYVLQLYCDFSGYSDIAIGLALLLGFRFPLNFNAPYRADSISDLWRRWHISLSSWVKDYVYIPLGGNRKGRWRGYANLFVTMVVCGLWHGAALNFVVWGAVHGLACVVHRMGRQYIFRHPSHYHSQGVKRVFAIVFTVHFWAFSCIFFRNSSFESIGIQFRQLFTAFHPEIFFGVIAGYGSTFFLIVLGFVLHYLPSSWNQVYFKTLGKTPLPALALLFTLLVYVIIQVKGSAIQPFIYFQF